MVVRVYIDIVSKSLQKINLSYKDQTSGKISSEAKHRNVLGYKTIINNRSIVN